ncbi:MAG: DUF6161 domain-containing protein [Candidatus Thiodiazotropha lotti]|uniref:DUF6161 domain-containing protein n=1 Tax=Candidatus Thiodiazotropha lotti TaxID=2792787 RepID=A0A9E4K4F8_9GAMM|nr:DUF6161 domain-containing protein [Candidatus Thiodiazotropha lotti]MCW4203965.1 DUF6161 domain-containing protein [Candidatus Thiodiazotropha lotti]
MTEENNNADDFITLKLDTGVRTFETLEELYSWKANEDSAFNWITNTSARDGSAAAGWNKIVGWHREIDNFFNQYNKSNAEQKLQLIKTLQSQTEQSFEVAKLITSTSAHGKFILQLKETESVITAAYALNYLMEVDNVIFKSVDALKGAILAQQYLIGSNQTVESIRNSLEALYQKWDDKFSSQYEINTKNNLASISEFDNFKSTFSSLQSDIAKEKNKQIEDFDKIINNSSQKLSDIEQTYDNKLATAASVNYWKKKKSHHQTVMFVMGFITLFFSLGTGALFVYIAHELLKESISNVPLWKLGVVFAISTFGIWLTRLTSKIFISNLHLRTDADERTTMIQTYLALLREGTGPKDDERQLILQTLFRPSNSGFIKEDGNAGFQESIAKLFQPK